MSISWQTGEPPRGVELLIEFEYEGNGRRMVSILDDEVLTRICILRWSTLDDDRSAMAMWALEKYLRHTWLDQVHIGVGEEAEGFALYNVDRELGAEATTLIEAIEKLTADQQTKGATDGQA